MKVQAQKNGLLKVLCLGSSTNKAISKLLYSQAFQSLCNDKSTFIPDFLKILSTKPQWEPGTSFRNLIKILPCFLTFVDIGHLGSLMLCGGCSYFWQCFKGVSVTLEHFFGSAASIFSKSAHESHFSGTSCQGTSR